MIFLVLLKAIQCEYGDNVNAKQIQILLTPVFLKTYDGKMMTIKSSCGTSATFKISKSLKRRLFAPNCEQKQGDTVTMTVGSLLTTCHQYGYTIDDMQITVATDKEYQKNQKQREAYNHKVTDFYYDKEEAQQQCETRNSQIERESLQYNTNPKYEDCAKMLNAIIKDLRNDKIVPPKPKIPTRLVKQPVKSNFSRVSLANDLPENTQTTSIANLAKSESKSTKPHLYSST